MNAPSLRVLLIEDNPGDAQLVQEALADQAPGEFAIIAVERLADALARIRTERFDAVLCDLGLPDSTGLGAVQAVVADAPALPLVVLTGSHNEDLGRAAINIGAQDYLVKGETRAPTIARTLRYAIERKRLEIGLRTANEALERRVAERTVELDTANSFLRANVARYRAVTQSATDAVIAADATGGIVGWNVGAERMFGYAEAEVLGQSLTLLMPQRFHDAHSGGMHGIQAGGERRLIGRTVELYGLSKGGNEFPIELSISEWETPEGRFLTGIIRDITERKRTEMALANRNMELDAALQEARDVAMRYRELTETAMDAIITVDERQNIVLFNAAAERMFGYSGAQAIGQPLERLLPESFRAAHREHVHRFHDGASAVARDAAIFGLRADGTQFPAEASISRVTIAQGTLYTAILRDVTERKRTENALRQQTAELRARNEELARFNRAAAGRELRMIELKREVNDLAAQLGRPQPYALAFMDAAAAQVAGAASKPTESAAVAAPLPTSNRKEQTQ